MSLDLDNAIESDAAHWRMRWDGALNWICGSRRKNPRCFLDTGALILRRWPAPKYPIPVFPVAVGFALRPAVSVQDQSESGVPNTLCWLMVDRVSGGGVVSNDIGRNAQFVAYDGDGNHVGLMPNPPLALTQSKDADGGLILSWQYNPVGQQVAPEYFYIYTDQGGGTISETYYARVAYVPGKWFYDWRKASSWSGWQWVVLAETSGRVKSPTPLRNGRGLSPTYGLEGDGISWATEVQYTCEAETGNPDIY